MIHPLKNNFPVVIDVPDILDNLGVDKDATEMLKAVGGYTLIALYYLLRVGEYTVEWNSNDTNQFVQFKLEDAMLFCWDDKGFSAN